MNHTRPCPLSMRSSPAVSRAARRASSSRASRSPPSTRCAWEGPKSARCRLALTTPVSLYHPPCIGPTRPSTPPSLTESSPDTLSPTQGRRSELLSSPSLLLAEPPFSPPPSPPSFSLQGHHSHLLPASHPAGTPPRSRGEPPFLSLLPSPCRATILTSSLLPPLKGPHPDPLGSLRRRLRRRVHRRLHRHRQGHRAHHWRCQARRHLGALG